MAGFIVGSLFLTWVLCSALNSLVEYAAIRQWINRGKAFLIMVIGVCVVAAIVVSLANLGFPNSTIARDSMNPNQVANAIRTSCVIDILFALGYCGFQLRRFWEDS